MVKMYCCVTQIMSAATGFAFQTVFSFMADCIDNVSDTNVLRKHLDIRRKI